MRFFFRSRIFVSMHLCASHYQLHGIAHTIPHNGQTVNIFCNNFFFVGSDSSVFYIYFRCCVVAVARRRHRYITVQLMFERVCLMRCVQPFLGGCAAVWLLASKMHTNGNDFHMHKFMQFEKKIKAAAHTTGQRTSVPTDFNNIIDPITNKKHKKRNGEKSICSPERA